MRKIDGIDGRILNEIQEGIPIEKNPFRSIAKKLGLSEEDVVNSINRLKKDGYIRRFGGLFDSQRLGIVSILVAVKSNNLEKAVEVINNYRGVTHNYQRDDEYNIWFTLMSSSKEEMYRVLDEIKNNEYIEDMLILPSTNKHKVKVYLHFNEK